MIRWPSRWPQVALAGVCIAMLAAITAELRGITAAPVVRTGSAAERGAADEPAAAPLRFVMPPAGSFAEITARPLFSPTRRPGLPAGKLAASSSFTLVGTVISGGDRSAILGLGQSGKIVRVREGRQVEGWAVEAILPDRVIVRRGDVREAIKPPDLGQGAGRTLAASVEVAPAASADTSPPGKWHHTHDQ